MKEYLQLNRHRLAPVSMISVSQDKYNRYLEKLAQLKAIEADTNYRVSTAHAHKDSMSFDIPGILLPVLSAFLPALIMIVIKYAFGIESSLELGKLRWIAYVVLIGCSVIEAMIVNDKRDHMMALLPRAVWLVLCVYWGWVRRTMLFGSEFNWLYANMIVNVIIVLIERMLEYSKRIGPNLKVFKQDSAEVEKANQLVEELAQLHKELGAEVQAEQEQLIRERSLPWKPEARAPWFAHIRKGENKLCMPQFAFYYNARTDFRHKGASNSENVRVLYDEVTFDAIPAAEARKMVAEKKLAPFFEYGLPVLTDDMEYRVYRHRWNIQTTTKTTETYTEKVADGRELYEFDSRTDSFEWDVYHGKAENHIANSAQDAYWRDRYLDKKQKARESLFHEVTRTRTERSTDVDEGDQIAFMQVVSPDRQVVGIYTANTKQAVEFTMKKFGYKLNPAAVANNDAQLGMLYNAYLWQPEQKRSKTKYSNAQLD